MKEGRKGGKDKGSSIKIMAIFFFWSIIQTKSARGLYLLQVFWPWLKENVLNIILFSSHSRKDSLLKHDEVS